MDLGPGTGGAAAPGPPPPPTTARTPRRPASSPSPGPRPWLPERALVTDAAMAFAHGRAMVERVEALGVAVERVGKRLPSLGPKAGDPRAVYRAAKRTLAIVTAPPGKRRLQPIPPSADWRVDLAEGCPAHCQYCYLAGSLSGAPLTRAYANLDEILAVLPDYLGRGGVTSASAARAAEGTTFEASCFTDPLGIEHLTGSLAAAIARFGAWDAPAQLRFTTKYSAVGPLLELPHRGRTRVRFSVNAARPARYLEGGTSPVAARLAAMGRMAGAGYPVGLVVAPVIVEEGWAAAYDALLADAAAALAGAPGTADPTVEVITHRFTARSKDVLAGWYPGSGLDMDEAKRTRKFTKTGAVKHVYPAPLMRELRAFFADAIARHLPGARLLYFT